MRIVTLMENMSESPAFEYEHGLSLYIETPHHHLLMDTGQSGAFTRNADRLGIDLGKVDTVILSHGHYDHTGGVSAFSKINPHADVYLQSDADGEFYHEEKYIGIDREILRLPKLDLICGDLVLDEELSLFSGITGNRCRPESNLALMRREADGTLVPDSFSHEQCLVVRENEKTLLLSGCAHNGILNILDRYREKYHSLPDAVISGFHMMKSGEYTIAEVQTIRAIAAELKQMPTLFYTGHCTGEPAFAILREILGEQMQPIHSGTEISLF